MSACRIREGQVYGRLTVLSRGAVDKHGAVMWLCHCECGSEVSVRGPCLTRGQTSCGCITREVSRSRLLRHEKTETAEHRSWTGLLSRCYNRRNQKFHRYGARGITVCDRWRGEHGFEHFLADMGTKPGPEYSIDRINNDGNYEPGNCRWATAKQQANNQSRPQRKVPAPEAA